MKQHQGLEELKRENEALRRRLAAMEAGGPVREDRHGREVSALLEGARALLDKPSFNEAARGLFDACKKITGATAGYVALLSESGEENEVLFLDAGGRECTVNPELPMPIRGLRATSYVSLKPAYENDFNHSKWMEFMPRGHVRLDNVLFAPIVIEGKAVGLLGLANKAHDFTERDARLAAAFGRMAAVALRESWAKEENERLIMQLKRALTEIKTLRGFVPICSHCKKIRDDQGYWQAIEKYLSEQTEAMLSHGICPDCARELYPELFNQAGQLIEKK